MTEIFAAIIGAFSAYIFNLFHWQIARKFDRRAQYLYAIKSKIDQFDELCTKYWITSNEGSNSNNKLDEITRKTYELQIKSWYKSLISHINSYITFTYKNEQERVRKEKDINTLLENIFDQSSGGDFEQKHRTEEPKRCSQINTLCTDLTVYLLRTLHD
jgi:hypothetical protein